MRVFGLIENIDTSVKVDAFVFEDSAGTEHTLNCASVKNKAADGDNIEFVAKCEDEFAIEGYKNVQVTRALLDELELKKIKLITNDYAETDAAFCDYIVLVVGKHELEIDASDVEYEVEEV